MGSVPLLENAAANGAVVELAPSTVAVLTLPLLAQRQLLGLGLVGVEKSAMGYVPIRGNAVVNGAGAEPTLRIVAVLTLPLLAQRQLLGLVLVGVEM